MPHHCLRTTKSLRNVEHRNSEIPSDLQSPHVHLPAISKVSLHECLLSVAVAISSGKTENKPLLRTTATADKQTNAKRINVVLKTRTALITQLQSLFRTNAKDCKSALSPTNQSRILTANRFKAQISYLRSRTTATRPPISEKRSSFYSGGIWPPQSACMLLNWFSVWYLCVVCVESEYAVLTQLFDFSLCCAQTISIVSKMLLLPQCVNWVG